MFPSHPTHVTVCFSLLSILCRYHLLMLSQECLDVLLLKIKENHSIFSYSTFAIVGLPPITIYTLVHSMITPSEFSRSASNHVTSLNE